jgi:type IV secretory pathway TrbD component
MGLDARDAAQLERIERQMARDDPRLAEAFERWTDPAGMDPAGTDPAGTDLAGTESGAAGQETPTIAPPWVLAVFLVGLATWVAGSVPGLVVAVFGVWVVCWLRRPPRHPGRRAAVRSRGARRHPRDPPAGLGSRARCEPCSGIGASTL